MVFWNGKFDCNGCVSHCVGCNGIMDATGRAKELPRVEKCKAEALARHARTMSARAQCRNEAERREFDHGRGLQAERLRAELDRAERFGYDTETCLANAAECGGL